MIESVAVRQRGAYDFETHYNNLCALQNSCPIPAVKAHLACGKLDINGDRMRTTDWMPILNTLRINKTLSSVSVHSYYQQQLEDEERQGFRQKKIPAIRSKEITYRLCKALKECLWVTPALSSLELHGLPLRSRDLTALAKGLMKNCTLKHISLEGSRVADEGLEIICKGVKNSTSVTSLDFSGCSLGWKGADILAKVIKHQAMKRHNEAWQDSLRYRRPDLDRMSGVRRITINSNPMIGDQGAARLAEALKDDLWLKALDLQQSGLTNKGANALLDVLKYNTTIVVLDVRQNPMIDAEILRSIMEQVVINSNGQDSQYKWIKAPPLQDGMNKMKQRRRRTKTLQCSFGKKTTIKISASVGRRRSRSVGAAVSQPPLGPGVVKPGPGMPWRTAMRAARFRGYPPENISPQPGMYELGSEEGSGTTSPETTVRIECSPRPGRHMSLGQPRSRTRKNLSDSEIMTEFRSMKEVKVELEQLRRRLREETMARSKAEERMIEVTLENSRLKKCLDDYRARGSLLDDDSVLESIETSFQQFHSFLDMLRDAGLGQLINLAGIDQSKMPFPRAATSAPFAYPPLNSQPALKAATSLPSQPPVISIQSPVLPSVDEQDREQRLREHKQQDFHSELAHARMATSGSYIPPNVFPQNFQNGRDPTMQHPMMTSTSSDKGPTKFDELYQQCLTETEGVLSQTRQEIGVTGPPAKPPPAPTGPEGDAPSGPPPTLPKPANGWQVLHDDAHSDNQSEHSQQQQQQQRSHASSQHSVRSQHSSQPAISQRSGGRSRRSEKSKSAPGEGEGHYSETFEKSVSEISEQLEIEELAAVSMRSDKTANSDNDTF